MFSAILLVQDDAACAGVENLARESKQVAFQKTLYRFPPAFELNQLLNIHEPDLVFIDLSDWESALAAAADIRHMSPKTAIVGFGGGWGPGREAQCVAAGITELLVSPVTLKRFQEAVERAIHKMRAAVQENLFAFLPAKAGSGSTTIALNSAGYLADGSLAKKVLLIDGDLHSGVLSVLLECSHPFSVRDALEESAQLDYSTWTKFVAKSHGVDLLISSRRLGAPLPFWSHYHELLDFAASRYDRILVDLPEVVNDATVEIVRRAKRVFVVCTPELASLALAPQRCEELRSRGLPAEKISLILNRWQRGDPSANEVEKLMGHPVFAVFENDYNTVSKAAKEHEFVNRGKKLGKSFAAFAQKLLETRA